MTGKQCTPAPSLAVRTCVAKSCIIEESHLTYPQWINCESCNKWYHMYCIGLNMKNVINILLAIFVHCPFLLLMLDTGIGGYFVQMHA